MIRQYIVARAWRGRRKDRTIMPGRVVAVRRKDIDCLPTDLIGGSLVNVTAANRAAAIRQYREADK